MEALLMKTVFNEKGRLANLSVYQNSQTVDCKTKNKTYTITNVGNMSYAKEIDLKRSSSGC